MDTLHTTKSLFSHVLTGADTKMANKGVEPSSSGRKH